MHVSRIRLGVAFLGLLGALAAQPQKRKPAYEEVELAESGSITGTVTFDGTPPPPKTLAVESEDQVCHREPIPDESLVVSTDQKIRWAVVSIKKIASGKPFPQREANDKVTVDQQGCRFTPHVVVVPRGEKMRIRNSDGILHNVHTKSLKNRPINKAHAGTTEFLEMSFRRPERVRLTCDIHKWMLSWIIVVVHPYHAITGPDGTFRLDGVPPGNHVVEVWHEELGKLEKPVTVVAGEEVRVDFTMSQKAGAREGGAQREDVKEER